MKYSIYLLAALLPHIVCNADYVTVEQPQQSWNPIVSGGGIPIAQQINNSVHTVCVPNPITFSTECKHFRHHSSAPTYNLNLMSTEQLMWYFSANSYTEGEVLSHPMLYTNAAYLAIAKQLPRYSEFVEKYYRRFSSYSWPFKWWMTAHFRYRKGLTKRFERLHQECEEQRRKQEASEHRNREECARKQKELAAYCTRLEALTYDECILDAVPYSHHHARDKALTHIKTMTADRITQKYTVTPDTIAFAREYAIAEHDLNTLCGNAYEQQLHSELLEQLNEARSISTNYALQPKNVLIDAVCYGAAIGIEANRLQEPEIATAWANFGWKALEIMQGMGDALLLSAEHIIHIVQDPKRAAIECVQGLGNIVGYCARMIGTVAYWHELMEQGNGLLIAQEMDDVASKMGLCSTLYVEKLAEMSARDIAKNITHIAIDMVLTHKMIMLGSHLCSQLKPIVFDLIHNIHKEEAFIEFALQGAEELDNTRKISFLMEEAENTKNVIQGLGTFNAEIANNIEHITTAINEIIPNKIHHILTPKTGKHAWHLVCENALDWSEIKEVIKKVMLEGITTYRKVGFQKTLQIGTEDVVLTFIQRSNGSLVISDAWVKTI